MDEIDVLNNFCKMFIIHIYTYYMYRIFLGYKNKDSKNDLYIILFTIIVAVLYACIRILMNQLFIIPIIYCSYTIIIKHLTRQKLNYCLFVANLSTVITYIVYYISVVIAGMFLGAIYPQMNYNNPINAIIIFFIMFIITFGISKIKRLKNGVNFIKNIQNTDNISMVINIISIIVLIAFALPGNSKDAILYTIMTLIITILIITIIYWTKYHITKYYKNNMRDRTIEVQKLEIEDKNSKLEKTEEENLKLAEVIHKYNNRLSAIENALEEVISKNMNMEFSKELSSILDETKEISKSFAKESAVNKIKLPQTNISGIDNMFKYMQKEATEHKINFDLKLNNSIHNLIENTISKDKLETILGDHLRDAIIAIDNSNCTYRSILVTLGIIENCYELSIYDTGIEFEIDTLLKLGKERITTHKDTGGNGIGFMTTFETLKETKASLIIEEYNPKDSNHTKSINIRFDGKNEYKIYSYRVEEIKKQNKDKKIIIYGI